MLKTGDVINIVKGHKVYTDVPEHFIYNNRKGVFDKTSHTDVCVGDTLNGFPTDYLVGKYVVIKTSFDGGGHGHGPHDEYPDGHHVWAEHLFNGAKVDFYQSGAFTAMIEDIKPIARAKAHWTIEK